MLKRKVSGFLILDLLELVVLLRILRGGVFILFGIRKVNVTYLDFRTLALVTVFVRPVAELQGAGYNGHLAFCKVAGNKLGGSVPGYAVDKVCYSFAVSVAEITFACDGE